ncbi:hypothetical protein IEQ34_018207 [Dendrobium chrysotoxum]|uniref:Uncharacterized protein n=1 Tax=Dendrobium chrysotoxum TaxID=161865 RepID=A0AAV7GDQ6_DENCH|nr:hypothetical protein IEQ34_018207 [Dendrobium chrysotoxum]
MVATLTALIDIKDNEVNEKSDKGKALMQPSPIKIYTLIGPHQVVGKSIEEMMNHLKDCINKIDDGEATEKATMKFHDEERSRNILMEMTGGSLFRRAKKAICRGGSSRGGSSKGESSREIESITPSTPVHPDSPEEIECSGSQQTSRHSFCGTAPAPEEGRNKGMEPFKKKMLAEVESKFEYPGHICHWILQSLGVKWRNYKTTLKAEHWDSRPIEEILETVPAGVDQTQWCQLVNQWSKPKDQERAAKNSANAKKQTCPHTMGRVSSVRRQKETSIKDRLQLWKINRMHKDGTWSSEDVIQQWTQACKLLAEEGLTPEDGNIEANERVFAIVMGPEHSGRVRTQGFGVTPTRFFPQSKTEEGGGSGSNFGQIASLIEEFRSFRDNQMREFGSFCDEMRQFMQGFQMNHPPNGGSEMV